MLGKFKRKAVSIFAAAMLMLAMFSTTAEAARPGGGGGTNTAPYITLTSTIPTLAEDMVTTAKVTLSASDKEGNRFTWSILSTSMGTATLQGTINPTGTGTITVNYTAPANKNGTALVTVQAKDKSGAASTYTIYITISPLNDAPVCTTPPSISGTAAMNLTVSTSNGTWSDIETPAASLIYAYKWQLADTSSGINPVEITGATANKYTIASSDAGKYIRSAVTVTDTGDSGTDPLSTTAYSPWVLIGQQQPVSQPQYYVALGDSIAAGTNNQNIFGYSYRYTNTFSAELAKIFTGTTYSYKNDSFPGDTTYDLLTKLQTDLTIRSDVSKATIITISIGGNNLLSTAAPEGYSRIDDAAATIGINDFAADLPNIVAAINLLHTDNHLPQIYIMDMYNLYHPWERGWVDYSDGTSEEVFMHQFIYDNYISRMQAAIEALVTIPEGNVYHVNTYEAFENYNSRFVITNQSYVKQSDIYGSYFYSPYIEGAAVYSDALTRFDIYPFYPLLLDYANLDHYRDPHPDQEGHNVLRDVHLAKFKEVNKIQ